MSQKRNDMGQPMRQQRKVQRVSIAIIIILLITFSLSQNKRLATSSSNGTIDITANHSLNNQTTPHLTFADNYLGTIIDITANHSLNSQTTPHLTFTDNFQGTIIDEVNKYNIAKAFEFKKLSSPTSWCTHTYNRMNATGLLYVKMPKAASSTTSGVMTRIAKRVSLRLSGKNKTNIGDDICPYRVDHVQRVGKAFGNRNRRESIMVTTIRDPANRAISRIFYTQVSIRRNKPTDGNMLKWLNDTSHQFGTVSPGTGGFQLAYASLERREQYSSWSGDDPTRVKNPADVRDNVEEVMKQYDFMIVVERFDESLVAIKLLLDLDLTDILYLSSKHAGDYWYSGQKKNKCIPLKKSSKSAAVLDHLSSEEWYAKNYGDYLLYAAANRSLDMTIESLGRERFDASLRNYRRLLRMAEETCSPITVFPCSREGMPQSEKAKKSCYRKDWGCGYLCFDKYAANWTNELLNVD